MADTEYIRKYYRSITYLKKEIIWLHRIDLLLKQYRFIYINKKPGMEQRSCQRVSDYEEKRKKKRRLYG